MGTPAVPESEILRTIEAAEQSRDRYGRINTTKTADLLGLARATVQHRLIKLTREGRLGFSPVLPGFEIKETSTQFNKDGEVDKEWVRQKPESGEEFKVPEGHVVKGVSALVGPDGRVTQQWLKTREGVDPRKTFDELQEHFANFKPAAKPTKAPKLDYEDVLTLVPWSDPHTGLRVWGKEASRDWDLDIAAKVVRETFSKIIARHAPTEKAILLVGGDVLHADGFEARTPKSGHALDVDGRYPKVLLTACETIVENASLMLSKHRDLEIIVIPGNHDIQSAHAISFFLHAWFRNEPRVTVDISPSLFRFREFGKVMIGTTHGHAAKAKDMPAIMAAREPEMWGRTVHRYSHGFHVHHASKFISEGGGCITETHQIIAPQDAWHFNEGFLSGRSLQSITYDKQYGEIARVRVAVM